QTLFNGNAAVGGNAGAGQAVYAQSCIACHGPKLEGSPFAPTLVGETFMSHWRGKAPAEFLTQMKNTMPPKGAGVVKPEAYPDLMAFLVKANLEGPPNLAVASAESPVAVSEAKQKPLSAELARKLEALSPVTEAMLVSPPEADWLMWRRTFDSAGFSPLK